MKIGVIAAEAFELEPLVKRLSDPRNAGLPLRYSRVGRCKEIEVVCAADGSGGRVAGNATRLVIDRYRPDAVWSIGLCGGLDEGLEFAQVVYAAEVVDKGNGDRFRCESLGGKTGSGVAVSQDRVALTIEEKRRLRELGSIVEMEAAGVARVASSSGIPFQCLKVVSDTAQESMSIDLNAAQDAAGRIVGHRVVAQALQSPLSGIRELFRLWRRSRIAAERLGEFLGDCRV